MPDWKELADEINASGSTHDIIRRKYLFKLHKYTNRNVIAYYSGWLQKKELIRKGVSGFDINDEDKNGFMSAIHKLDRTKGLDLILHTPGGEISATESIVNYLRKMFNNDIRAIVPQIAMSAGTMMACACKEIIMGYHSDIGPIDPQTNGVPAHGIIEEFYRAISEVQQNPDAKHLWQPIIAKYNPTLIGECEKAIKMSNTIVEEWLISGMLDGDAEAKNKAKIIIKELGTHALTLSHGRHISINKAKEIGLKVKSLEEDQKLQEAVLTVHHAIIHTLEDTSAFKIIENHNGIAYIKHAGVMMASQIQ
jgi:hypothetical protein